MKSDSQLQVLNLNHRLTDTQAIVKIWYKTSNKFKKKNPRGPWASFFIFYCVFGHPEFL